MTELLIAKRSAMVTLDGALLRVRRGRTLAHAEHPIVAADPTLWRPMPIDYDVETTTSPVVPDPPAPADPDAEADEAATRPAAGTVRAWARANEVDVPARGPIPDDVYAAYTEAHPPTEET